jgi:hypothetical protein
MGRKPEGGQEKKLIAAVDYWFHGGSQSSGGNLLDDAAAFGVDLPAAPVEEDFHVWPENHDVVLLFLRCQTQWRSGGTGVIGLDYGVALSLASLSKMADPLEVIDDLQIMEMHAIALINEACREVA